MISNWWVVAINVTGPLGIVRGGVRNFFKSHLSGFMIGEIRWNATGTRLRIIAHKSSIGDLQNILDTLGEIQT